MNQVAPMELSVMENALETQPVRPPKSNASHSRNNPMVNENKRPSFRQGTDSISAKRIISSPIKCSSKTQNLQSQKR